jgi:phosphatidate cytidylyltransferase
VALGIIAALGASEYFALARARGLQPLPWVGIPASVALAALTGAFRSFEAAAPWAFGIVLGVFLLSAASAVWLRWPEGSPMTAIPVTLSGVLYTGGTLSFGFFLRHLPESGGGPETGLPVQGFLFLILPLAVTWLGDSAAYFFGHAVGNQKLLPAVSPGKTVEGGAAGLTVAVFVGGGLGATILGLHPDVLLSAVLGGVLGLILGAGAQIGDLAESILKREAGVKDSGALLPGHGGILDRFDSLYFTLPMAYFLIRAVGLLS